MISAPQSGTGTAYRYSFDLPHLLSSRGVRFIGLLLFLAVLSGFKPAWGAGAAALCILATLAYMQRTGTLNL